MAVYFIEAIGVPLVKIGVTRDLTKRFRMMQSCSPLPLVVAAVDQSGDLITEVELHHRFRDQRCRGEWFSISPELRSVIHTTALTGEIPDAWRLPDHLDSEMGCRCFAKAKTVFDRFGLDMQDYKRIIGVMAQNDKWHQLPPHAIPKLYDFLTSQGFFLHYHDLLAPAVTATDLLPGSAAP